MNATDRMRTIEEAEAIAPARLKLRWSDGVVAEIDLTVLTKTPAFAALRDPVQFAQVEIGDWGHSLHWPGGEELGADALWLETLTATGRADARTFLEWRLRHGLSLSQAALALGISRRMVAYYSNGEKRTPKPILLACLGWEVSHAA